MVETSLLLNSICTALDRARQRNHRHCLVLAGCPDWCETTTNKLIRRIDPERSVWLATTEPSDQCADWYPPNLVRNVLGSEASILVIDCHGGIDPDVVGAASGIVSGGGLLVLLRPLWKHHRTGSDMAQRLAAEPYGPEDVTHHYPNYFWPVVAGSVGCEVWDQEEGRISAAPVSSKAEISEPFEHPWARSAHQARAVEAIRKVATGRKRRPLVLTSDRGRGKSAALGISAGLLLAERACSILLIAPSRGAVEPVFQHAAHHWPAGERRDNTLAAGDRKLHLHVPADLATDLPKADIVFVDEAAAIPVPLLCRILAAYPRVVFSTTIHGYEGTGRGFAIRFRAHLDEHAPQRRFIHLDVPIRWAPEDPVEAMVFAALCLDARAGEFQDEPGPADVVTISAVTKSALIQDESCLRQVFGLLINAHYRTTPLDLLRLVDAPQTRLWTVALGDRVVGAALVTEEGGISAEMARAITRGQRRLPGHLLPQTLSAHFGLEVAPTLRAWRIVRIAIHRDWRRQGVGQELLERIKQAAVDAGTDFLGAAFGATTDLLAFWGSADFQWMRLGTQRGRSSGLYSAMVAQGTTQAGTELIKAARQRFATSLPVTLGGPLADLEADLALLAIQDLVEDLDRTALSPHERAELTIFADGGRPFEVIFDLLWRYALHRIPAARHQPFQDARHGEVLIQAILQRWDWQRLTRHEGIDGRADIISLLAEDCRLFLASWK